jgi:transposase, IS5 family
LAEASVKAYRNITRREQFLADMQPVVPWAVLVALIEPKYHSRPPIALLMMLRIYLLQQWQDLSAPSVEEALNDSVSIRRFVEIDFGAEAAPDETTISEIRYRLEAHHLGDKMFAVVNAHLAASSLMEAYTTDTKKSVRKRNPARLFFC